MTKQKKPKTGDVVGWIVLGHGYDRPIFASRASARAAIKQYSQVHQAWGKARLGRVLLAK